jgi:lysyl-tRNA synthetase class 2
MTVPFLEENDQTIARREHLEALRALVGNVYPNKFERSNVTDTTGGEDTITSIVAVFKEHEPPVNEGEKPSADVLEVANSELNKIHVRIAGRIAAPPRVMGKAAFVHLSDGVARLQLYVRRQDVVGLRNDSEGGQVDGWELFGLLDHGDFIGVEGYLFVTKTGELSVHVEKLQFLTKALLPMPDKMHGINDPEIRQRQRYADLIAGSLKLEERDPNDLTPRQVFELRSKVVREIRRFLDEHGYVEVETPMLTAKATGALAKPFETHHKALDIKLYARIAPELYLKRLVVGGFEKVYELNRNFRNEGISTKHNPEFTMLEYYWAYADVNDMMDLHEEMMRAVVQTVLGDTHVRYGVNEIDFSQRFARMSMKEAILKHQNEKWLGETNPIELSGGIDSSRVDDFHYTLALSNFVETIPGHIRFLYPGRTLEQILEGQRISREEETKYWIGARKTAENAVSSVTDLSTDRMQSIMATSIETIFEYVAEPHLIQPTFITDFPKPISPLSKASPSDPSVAERFEYFVGALESANGFSELNDPEEQYQRFKEQGQQRERGDEEAMVMDEDYIRALAYGMPPAAGIGVGIDRLVMLLANKQSIRDVILFPHMRPERPDGSRQEADGRTESSEQ